MDLGVARRDLFAGAALQSNTPAIDIGQSANAVPLELVTPRRVGARKPGRELGHHRLDALWHRLAIGILGRIHAMDHPVVAAGLKKYVATRQPLAVELDHDLAIGPLHGVVSSGVLAHHLAPALLTFRDLARAPA